MPTYNGVNSLTNITLPGTWDTAELTRLRLRDGTSYEAILNDINAAVQIVNSGLNSNYYGGMVSLTTDLGVEYRSGVSTGFEDATEYTQPDAQRAESYGHMLPLRRSDRKMGWTTRWLEEARRINIDDDIAAMLSDVTNLYEQRVLTRFFKSTAETGRAYGLGANGVSLPFADGSQTYVWTPPPRPDRGGTFANTHSHYLRLDGITQANVETAVKHIWEHGIDGPYDLIVSLADVDAWTNATNVTGYVQRPDALVTYGANTTLSTVDSTYLGVVTTKYGTCRLVYNGRIPTKYWGVYKTFGSNDPRNPLRIRYDEPFGFGARLVVERVDLYPLAGAIARFDFGVGIGADRVSAVLVRNHTSGNYSDPVIA